MFFLNFRQHPLRSLSAALNRETVGGSSVGLPAVLDEAALDRLRGLDPTGAAQLMPRVLTAFDASLARLMPQLASAQGLHDCNAIRLVAHTLKSSSASLGALHLSKLCAELEGSARRGELDGLDARVDAMRAECEIVVAALQQTFSARP